ncbi:MAG: hypothetical protein M3Y64_00560 [Gemmatimonadota bacterium]|nr:hypothetical protein [Gemmatimonadota bacterium]
MMNRQPSLLLRATRALVGLVTVWCLGCVGYEPIVDSLRGASASTIMDCASMSAGEMVGGSQPTQTMQEALSLQPTISEAPVNGAFDCGCGGFCHAVSITYNAVAVSPLNVLKQLQQQPAEPASVSRAPLLPPPQRVV